MAKRKCTVKPVAKSQKCDIDQWIDDRCEICDDAHTEKVEAAIFDLLDLIEAPHLCGECAACEVMDGYHLLLKVMANLVGCNLVPTKRAKERMDSIERMERMERNHLQRT